ncbi:MAG: excinuclease ABC subunit UvrA, partial [Saprospiraceae bacterium]|nr:excinuclease ABC subunit UvrA [Saprospiraceae bacterium]
IGKMDRPDVEQIFGLSPVISIEQKTTGWNPRSTVGTITEIYDFLRLLYARIGEAYSYESGKRMIKFSEEEIIQHVLKNFNDSRVVILAPVVRARKGHYRELFEQIRKQGYAKVRVDGEMLNLEPGLQVERFKTHDIEIVVDRLRVQEERRDRLAASLYSALKLGDGFIMILDYDTQEMKPYSKQLMDPISGISYEEPSPNAFSFNSPYGACPRCDGLGKVTKVDPGKVVPDDSKTINEGGIAPFGEVRDNYTFKQLRAIAKRFGFTFAIPIRDIPTDALEIVLHGGDDSYHIKLPYSKHDFTYNLPQEGLYRMLERWYKETSSDKIQRWAEDFMTISTCDECLGQRLKKESLHFRVAGKNISELADMDLNDLHTFFEVVEQKLTAKQKVIAKDILKEIRMRLQFLLYVGLDYLTLNRPARSLSGGESQRTRLANQIGSQLTGITYILDEPSIGLHQRDNHRLIHSLKELTEIGNTVLVVEHDKDIMLASDYVIDLGPGAGDQGGSLVAQGAPERFMTNAHTLTAEYLSNRFMIPVPGKRRKGNGSFLTLKGAAGNNLKRVNMKIPLATFTCVTGVSGSGKSSLINETLYPILRKEFYRSRHDPLPYAGITGISHLDKVIEIDQAPIGRTPRSNPATYTGVFTDIRKLFSDIPESKIRGYKPGRFSFNVKGGRCETCQGGGMRVIEMNFLPDVLVHCEECMGKRYNRETLEIVFKGKSISDVLDMSVDESAEFFKNIPKIYRKLKTIREVGLGYITLGQQATTLSGGEAQRVKLAEELAKRDTGSTLYILDEPTTGLHFDDIRQLLVVLNKLVDKGNTVIVIEHNMDVIKVADYIFDLGPEGGFRGGKVVVHGTPEKVSNHKTSYTGYYLKKELAASNN